MNQSMLKPLEPRAAQATGLRLAVLALVATIGGGVDTLLVEAIATDRLMPVLFIVLHLGTVLSVGLASAWRARDGTPAILLALGIAVMGPFGAAGALVLIVGEALAQPRDALLDEWYGQLSGSLPADDPQSLYDDIVEGRAYRPAELPHRFADIMSAGSVEERQAVLGLLVKQREPVPQALLETALRSRDVAVRASAAATLSRLREKAALVADGGVLR